MGSLAQNRLVIVAIGLTVVFLLCVIFGALAFLAVNQITLSSNVVNLSASLAAQDNRASTQFPRALGTSARGDVRGTAEGRRQTPTP